MQVSGARRPGRGHRRADVPCQDAFAARELPTRGAVVFAVADGLGSKPLSHIGSEVAVQAAVARLADEERWNVRAMLRTFRAARRALRTEAAARGVPVEDLATTLQVGVLGPDRTIAAMVGDGAMVAGGTGGATGTTDVTGTVRASAATGGTGAMGANGTTGAGGGLDAGTRDQHVLLAPEVGGYANEVVPLTARQWRQHFQYAECQEARWMLGFTDGLTRLLLRRDNGAWSPYEPFWEAVVPRLEARPFPVDLAQRVLAGDNVDASWDDDKCLVAVVRDAGA